jgi:arginine/lysine/ornithine decarboxylase
MARKLSFGKALNLLRLKRLNKLHKELKLMCSTKDALIDRLTRLNKVYDKNTMLMRKLADAYNENKTLAEQEDAIKTYERISKLKDFQISINNNAIEILKQYDGLIEDYKKSAESL